MRPGRTVLPASLFLLCTATVTGAADPAVITASRHDGALIVARGTAPPEAGPGSLAAAVDDDGFLIAVLETISAHGDEHRLQTVDVRWPHAVRGGLEVRWFDTTRRRGLVVWSDVWGAPLVVDGVYAARLPAVLKINTGTHELVALLPDGVRAGATVTGPIEGPSLLLRGVALLEDPALGGSRDGPASDEPTGEVTSDRDTVKRWIDVPGMGRFYRAGGAVTGPRRVEEALPPYPERLQNQGIEGWAVLCAYVDAGGAVRAISRVAEARPVFAGLGMEALRLFRFDPATLDGEPAPATYMITMRWGLE